MKADHKVDGYLQNGEITGICAGILARNLFKLKVCSFSATRYINHVSLATLALINDYKAQSYCNQDPTFRHSSLVSSSGLLKYPRDDVTCQWDACIPLANRHRHPYSKHDYSHLYATLLGKAVAIVCGNYFRVFPRNLVFSVTHMLILLKLIFPCLKLNSLLMFF
jgi:hypothetical protein